MLASDRMCVLKRRESLTLDAVSISACYDDGGYSVAVPWKEQMPC